AQRVVAHTQAAARAAERQGLPAPLPRGTIQRTKDPYGKWLQNEMYAQGLGKMPRKKFNMNQLFRPDPHKLPKGFVPFDGRRMLVDESDLLNPPHTEIGDTSTVTTPVPEAPPMTEEST